MNIFPELVEEITDTKKTILVEKKKDDARVEDKGKKKVNLFFRSQSQVKVSAHQLMKAFILS